MAEQINSGETRSAGPKSRNWFLTMNNPEENLDAFVARLRV